MYSKPQRLITDRGTAFTSFEFRKFIEDEKIIHVLIAVSTPRANGQVERFNRVITPMLAKMCEVPKKWDESLERVEFAINNTVSKATGVTPSKLLFGIEQTGEITDTMRLMFTSNDDRNLQALRDEAEENIKNSQSINEEKYNTKRKSVSVCEIGEYV